ncbi:hypothetical protein ACUR5C_13040 [Aliikangiella sp. IMCC44653]
MATILEFKPRKKIQSKSSFNPVLVTTSVNDLMLIIHHALHGTERACQPIDKDLASQLLIELSVHLKTADEPYQLTLENMVLSQSTSSRVVERYPEMLPNQGSASAPH